MKKSIVTLTEEEKKNGYERRRFMEE